MTNAKLYIDRYLNYFPTYTNLVHIYKKIFIRGNDIKYEILRPISSHIYNPTRLGNI